MDSANTLYYIVKIQTIVNGKICAKISNIDLALYSQRIERKFGLM